MSAAKPYAACLNCGAEFDDREAMYAHQSDTLAPTGATSGVTARGHRVRVENPTPEEVEATRIRWMVSRAVDEAIESAMGDLLREVERGRITAEQVAAELRGTDFEDAWAEWVTA
ncbi:hypothetical protein [Actinotalea sp.]|uniref:hypothetical protein n=1 Tax=Actinotalea sp. TaxID=1872145 RepID=UPI003564ABA3